MVGPECPVTVLHSIHQAADIPVKRRMETALHWSIEGIHQLDLHPFERFLDKKLESIEYYSPDCTVPIQLSFECNNREWGYNIDLQCSRGLSWTHEFVPGKGITWYPKFKQYPTWSNRLRRWDINSNVILSEWEIYVTHYTFAEVYWQITTDAQGNETRHMASAYLGKFFCGADHNLTWEMVRVYRPTKDFQKYWESHRDTISIVID